MQFYQLAKRARLNFAAGNSKKCAPSRFINSSCVLSKSKLCQPLAHPRLKTIEKWRIVAALSAAAVVVLCFAVVTLSGTPKAVSGLSVVFLRYSDEFDSQVSNVAFLFLTNASNKSYGVTMPGATNSHMVDTVFGRSTASYLVNCEFFDQTANGSNHWAQKFSALMPLEPFTPVNVTGPRPHLSAVTVPALATAFAVVRPHSGLTIRVPTLPTGQSRKVAVLCEEIPELKPALFWSSRAGLFLQRKLPISLVSKFYTGGPVLKVWCDRELSRTGAGDRQLPSAE